MMVFDTDFTAIVLKSIWKALQVRRTQIPEDRRRETKLRIVRVLRDSREIKTSTLMCPFSLRTKAVERQEAAPII